MEQTDRTIEQRALKGKLSLTFHLNLNLPWRGPARPDLGAVYAQGRAWPHPHSHPRPHLHPHPQSSTLTLTFTPTLRVHSGEFKLIYLTPEKLMMSPQVRTGLVDLHNQGEPHLLTLRLGLSSGLRLAPSTGTSEIS